MMKMVDMDRIAILIVSRYIAKHLDKAELHRQFSFDVFIVWKCKTLRNWKWMISSTLSDGMYYEVTYNGEKEEFYLDAYRKIENQRIPLDEGCEIRE